TVGETEEAGTARPRSRHVIDNGGAADGDRSGVEREEAAPVGVAAVTAVGHVGPARLVPTQDGVGQHPDRPGRRNCPAPAVAARKARGGPAPRGPPRLMLSFTGEQVGGGGKEEELRPPAVGVAATCRAERLVAGERALVDGDRPALVVEAAAQGVAAGRGAEG